jgi:hypothetical protein
MKAKLLQVADFLKAVGLYVFKIALKVVRAIIDETIYVLQKLQAVVTQQIGQ